MENYLQLCIWIFKAKTIFTLVVQILALRSPFSTLKICKGKWRRKTWLIQILHFFLESRECSGGKQGCFLCHSSCSLLVVALGRHDLQEWQSKHYVGFTWLYSKTLSTCFHKLISKWNHLHFSLKVNGCWNTESISEFGLNGPFS